MDLRELPVHWTKLAKINMSPAHYEAAVKEEFEDTLQMRIGRLVHTMVLGGPEFVTFEGTRRGKAWDAFQAENEGREIVTTTEVEAATAIADAVKASAVATPFLVGEREKPLVWTGLGGRLCATRGIDVLGDVFLTDLKTTKCSEPKRFNADARWRCYHAQLAWYREAVRTLFGREINDAYIVAVETAAPHCVTVLHLGARVLEEGEKINRLWMERLLACEAAGEFPPYVQTVQEFALGTDAPSLLVDGEVFEFDGAAA